jgi:nucleotidyltransferase/DNA polymerase involved in DNA repair
MIACLFTSLFNTETSTASLEKLSREVAIFLIARTPAVECAGSRGWFVDLTGCERLLRNDFAGWAVQIAGLLNNRFGLTIQVGIASNKVTAELACRLATPGSVLWLFPEEEKEVINRAALQMLPCLTEAQLQVFRDRRLQWVWEVKALGEDCLRQWLSHKEGSEVWQMIHGICNDPVKPWRVPRLLKKTYTFTQATACQQDVIRAGVYLAGSLYHEIHKLGGVLRRISCRLIYVDDLETSREVHVATLDREEEHAAAVARMLENMSLRRVQVRSLQLKCPVEFEAAEQQDLFSERERLRRRDLEQALKDVREKYGVEALHRASGTARRRARQGHARR